MIHHGEGVIDSAHVPNSGAGKARLLCSVPQFQCSPPKLGLPDCNWGKAAKIAEGPYRVPEYLKELGWHPYVVSLKAEHSALVQLACLPSNPITASWEEGSEGQLVVVVACYMLWRRHNKHQRLVHFCPKLVKPQQELFKELYGILSDKDEAFQSETVAPIFHCILYSFFTQPLDSQNCIHSCLEQVLILSTLSSIRG
jgi:hypothetical protein